MWSQCVLRHVTPTGMGSKFIWGHLDSLTFCFKIKYYNDCKSRWSYEQVRFRVQEWPCYCCELFAGLEFRRESESPLAPNKSVRIQLDSHKLSNLSHTLNGGESKDSGKLHPGESKWTLIALYEVLALVCTLNYRFYYYSTGCLPSCLPCWVSKKL